MNQTPSRIPLEYSDFLNNIVINLLEKNYENRLNVVQLKQMLDKYNKKKD